MTRLPEIASQRLGIAMAGAEPKLKKMLLKPTAADSEAILFMTNSQQRRLKMIKTRNFWAIQKHA
jgi:hypothetical protein